MTAVFLAIAAVLVVASLGCIRISEWHSSESRYWSSVAMEVRFDPSRDEVHRPVLLWVQANRPSIWERLRGWQKPPVRMWEATR